MMQLLKSNYIFLIDGMGALLTALLLLIFIAPLESFFGFPADTSRQLSLLAVGLGVFSLTCFILKPSTNKSILLNALATANFFYCLITLALVTFSFREMKIYGIIYFTVEIMIIEMLAFWEWKLARTKT